MGLIDIIKQDIEEITSDLDGFAKAAVMIAPNGFTAEVNLIHTKHHLGFDSQSGRDVNFKNAHVSVSEKFLTDKNYPVRNSSGAVNLAGHKVTVADSTGASVTYVVREWMPDETIGLILMILGDFKE